MCRTRTTTAINAVRFAELAGTDPSEPLEYQAERAHRRGLGRELSGRVRVDRKTPDRPLRDPQRYGRGWSPVLVAWTTPEQARGLAGRVAGLGGSSRVVEIPSHGSGDFVSASRADGVFEIPSLGRLLIISDGLNACIGSVTANKEWFLPWKTIEGEGTAPTSVTQLEVLLKGVFEKRRFLDLIRYCFDLR